MSLSVVRDAYKTSEIVDVFGKVGDDAKRKMRRILSKYPHELREDGTGNKAKFFITATLPDEIRIAISNYEDEQQQKRDMAELSKIASCNLNTKASSPPKKPVYFSKPAALAGADAARKIMETDAQDIEDRQKRRTRLLAMFYQLPDSSKQVAEGKLHMLTACKSFLYTKGFKGRKKSGKECWNTKGVKVFCNAFINGILEIPAYMADHFTRNGKRSITPATLWNWRELYDDQGLYGLADHYSSTKGSTSLSILQQEFCVSFFIEKPGASIRMITKALGVRFKDAVIPSRHTVARFLDTWLKNHESLYLFMTNPDAWRSKYQYAFGDADENIIRLNQRWEGDSTKADVMCSDGRFCIVGNIDVWSRRPKLLLSPTSKSSAIGMLLRRCIMDWGMPEEFRTDNGSEYTSYYIERILDHLDVIHHLCDPFTPEQKPHIERFFKTFSHGIVPLLDGYIGHDVTERNAIESRKSFAKRLMTRGETVDVNISSTELQAICDRWVNSMYCQEIHSKLGGMSPASKARSWTEPIKRIYEERALDVLLSPAPSNDGWRVITKKGVEVTFCSAKLWYKAAEFAGYEGKRVRVLIDVTDLGHATIFQEDGLFLCIAEDPKWYGISNQELATHTKRRQKALLAESQREHKEMVKRTGIGDIAEEILQDREEKMAKVSELPKTSTNYTTSALKQAGHAVVERERRASNPALEGIIVLSHEILESEARKAQKIINIADSRGRKRHFAGESEIYDYLLNLRSLEQVDDVELQWIKDYEYMLDNPNKVDSKKGLILDDPYLLKHWKRVNQVVGQ